MPVAGYQLYGALWQRAVWGIIARFTEMRFQHTAMHVVWQGCQKIDSGSALTVITIKLRCVPGKGVIGLSWPSLNIWRQSKFPFRQE